MGEFLATRLKLQDVIDPEDPDLHLQIAIGNQPIGFQLLLHYSTITQ